MELTSKPLYKQRQSVNLVNIDVCYGLTDVDGYFGAMLFGSDCSNEESKKSTATRMLEFIFEANKVCWILNISATNYT